MVSRAHAGPIGYVESVASIGKNRGPWPGRKHKDDKGLSDHLEVESSFDGCPSANPLPQRRDHIPQAKGFIQYYRLATTVSSGVLWFIV